MKELLHIFKTFLNKEKRTDALTSSVKSDVSANPVLKPIKLWCVIRQTLVQNYDYVQPSKLSNCKKGMYFLFVYKT